MDPKTLESFQDEMEKIAINWGSILRRGATSAAKSIPKASKPAKGKFLKGVKENLKGTAKGFMNPMRGLKKGWESDGWGGQKGTRLEKLPIGGKTMTLMGGVGMAPEAFANKDPSGRDRSKLERSSQWAGNQIGGLIGAPFGFSGSIAGSIAGDAIGSSVGKTLDKIRGYKAKPKPVPNKD